MEHCSARRLRSNDARESGGMRRLENVLLSKGAGSRQGVGGGEAAREDWSASCSSLREWSQPLTVKRPSPKSFVAHSTRATSWKQVLGKTTRLFRSGSIRVKAVLDAIPASKSVS